MVPGAVHLRTMAFGIPFAQPRTQGSQDVKGHEDCPSLWCGALCRCRCRRRRCRCSDDGVCSL